jgi:aconitase A
MKKVWRHFLQLGVRVVLATSFHPMFRANLVKIGILPLKIDKTVYDAVSGREIFDIDFDDADVDPASFANSKIDVVVRDAQSVSTLQAEVQLVNAYEVKLFLDGGIICQMAKS